MVGPAAIYVGRVMAFDTPELMRGWAISCATPLAIQASSRPHWSVPMTR